MEYLRNKYMYNNEAIGIIAISAVLLHSQYLPITNALLVLPFLCHPGTVSNLGNANIKLRSIEEFVTKYPGLFSNFADRYESLLPVTINSIVTLTEAKAIKLEGNNIIPLKNFYDFIKGMNHNSKRASQIEKASKNLALLLQDKSINLYLHLRIKL